MRHFTRMPVGFFFSAFHLKLALISSSPSEPGEKSASDHHDEMVPKADPFFHSIQHPANELFLSSLTHALLIDFSAHQHQYKLY